MDIAAATSLSSMSLASDIGTRVARKTLDAAKQQGEAAVDMIKAASIVARETNQPQSGRLDVFA